METRNTKPEYAIVGFSVICITLLYLLVGGEDRVAQPGVETIAALVFVVFFSCPVLILHAVMTLLQIGRVQDGVVWVALAVYWPLLSMAYIAAYRHFREPKYFRVHTLWLMVVAANCILNIAVLFLSEIVN